jgi:MOSC domain-containing protein YiiM
VTDHHVAGAPVKHPTLGELEAGLAEIRQAPRDRGVLRLIVRRPTVGAREVIEEGRLDIVEGLVGDTWSTRGSSRSRSGPHPDMQLNLMNARSIALIAQSKERWALAGDQLFIDLDLSVDNVPPGSRLTLGSAMIEITAEPHTGCGKFASRFGIDAVKFVNSTVGKQLRLRGVNAKVVQAGLIRAGDLVQKIIP